MNYVNLVKLSEIAELITKGTTPTTIGYDFQDEGVNFLKVECFDEKGVYLADKVAHISDECNEKLKRSQLKVGDILFSIAGAIGRVGIVTEGMLPANTNQALAIIRIKNKDIYLPYIRLVLTSPVIKKQFEKKKQGVAQLNLSLKDLNELSIPLPNKDKQKVIVDLFNRANILINYINNELEYLDKLIRARFVEMFGDLVVNPYKWTVVKLSDISLFLKSGLSRRLSDVDIGLPVIRSGNIQNGQFVYNDIKYWYKDDPQGANTEDYRLENGDILVNFINSTSQIGKTAIFSGVSRECIYTTNILRMKLTDSCNVYYYNWFAMSDYYYRQLQNIIQPAVNQASFTTVNFLKLNIPLPPLQLQKQFETFVHQVNKSKVEVQKALDKAQLLFDSLMQKYFG